MGLTVYLGKDDRKYCVKAISVDGNRIDIKNPKGSGFLFESDCITQVINTFGPLLSFVKEYYSKPDNPMFANAAEAIVNMAHRVGQEDKRIHMIACLRDVFPTSSLRECRDAIMYYISEKSRL